MKLRAALMGTAVSGHHKRPTLGLEGPNGEFVELPKYATTTSAVGRPPVKLDDVFRAIRNLERQAERPVRLEASRAQLAALAREAGLTGAASTVWGVPIVEDLELEDGQVVAVYPDGRRQRLR